MKRIGESLPTGKGYTGIPHAIMENVLCKYTFPAYEMRLMMLIMRQTFGWHRKGWYTTHREIAAKTSMHLRHVGRTLKALEERFIIATRKAKNKTHIEFNTNYMQWRLDETDTLFTCSGGNKVSPLEVTESVASRGDISDEEHAEMLEQIRAFNESLGKPQNIS